MRDIMAGHVERGQVPGIDGRLRAQRDRIFRIASTTRPLAAGLPVAPAACRSMST
jgi:hypothetical protein